MPTYKNRTTADIAIKRNSSVLLTVPITRQSRRIFKLMERDEITLYFSLVQAVHFQVGDYIDDEIFGKYIIKEEQTPNYNKSTGGYDYQLVFVAPYYVWDNHEFTLTNASSAPLSIRRQECSWHITNDLKANVKEFIRCLDAIGETYNGASYVMHIHKTAKNRQEISLMTYDTLGMVKALKAMADTWHCEWWVKYEVPEKEDSDDWILDSNGDNVTGNAERGVIHFGLCKSGDGYDMSERPYTVDGNTYAPSVEAMTSQRNESEHANRLFVLGGAANMPESYRKTLILEVESISWDADNNRNVYRPNRDLTEDMLDGASVSTETVTVKQPFEGTTKETLKAYASTSPWHFTRGSNYTRVYANIGVAIKFPTNPGNNWVIEGNAYLYRVTDGVETLIAEYNNTHALPLYRNESFAPPSSDFVLWFNNFWDFGNSIPVTGDTYDAIKIVVEMTANKSGLTIVDQYSVGLKTGINGYAQYSYEKRTATNRIETVDEGDKYDVLFNPCNNRRPSGVAPDGNFYYFFALDKDENGQPINDSNQGSPMLYVGQEFTVYGYNPVAIPLSWYTDNDLDSPMSLVGLGERRLRLPLPTGTDADTVDGIVLRRDYIEEVGIVESKRVELTVKNDDIYPKCFLKVTDVGTHRKVRSDVLSDGSENYWPYELYDLKIAMLDGSEFPFSTRFVKDSKLSAMFISEIDEQAAYGEAHLTPPETDLENEEHLLLLAGMTFECRWDDALKTLTLLTNEDYGAMLPNGILKPTKYDTLVLMGWDVRAMDELTLIDEAERKLLAFAREYMEELRKGQFTFNCDMMSDWPKVIHDSNKKGLHISGWYTGTELSPMLLPLEGSVARVWNESIPDGVMESRVLGYEFKLDYPFDTPRYIIGETEAYSRIRMLERNLTKAGSGGGSGSVSYVGNVQGGSVTFSQGASMAPRNNSSYMGDETSVSALEDVRIENGLTEGQTLVWNGSKWVNRDVTADIKELVFVDIWESALLAFNKTVWDGTVLYYYHTEIIGEQITAVEEIIPLRTDVLYIDIQHSTPYRWNGSEMIPLGEKVVVSGGNNAIVINGTTLNLTHGHDWGDIVNKPNLIEGITAGNGKLSFLHSNGDTTVADFSALTTAINSKASQASVDALVNQRGMLIDPLVWAATYDDDGFVWTNTLIGNYWFDTTTGKLKIFVGFILGEPVFPEVKGMFLVWHESTGELVMYSWYGTGSPSTITIFTQ